jgi:hypothetical protein
MIWGAVFDDGLDGAVTAETLCGGVGEGAVLSRLTTTELGTAYIHDCRTSTSAIRSQTFA